MELVTSEAELQKQLDELELRMASLEAARDAAERLAAARADLLAHVSHELRTPMNGILGMTRLALESELNNEQREYMNVVWDSAESLLTLVNNLLDQSRMTSGKLSLESIPFDLRALVRNVVKPLDVSAAGKGISLDFEIASEIPTLVVGDPGRLRQILVNLIGNAVKFTERGGVMLAVSKDSQSEDEIVIRIRVTDTGIGIPEDKLASIFEPYEQADSFTTREYGGSGLGLSISTQLVELMGGRITVDSEVGVGTTFHMMVPFDVDQTVATESAHSPLALSRLRLLFVADNAVNHRTIVELLDRERMAGMVVESLAEARRYLAKADAAANRFDVIVVDLRDNGIEGAAGLLSHPAAEHAASVLLTPSGQRGDAARCRQVGIGAYLTGTTTPNDLAEAIRAVMEGADGLVTRHWLRERRRRLHVLVADDSATNRLLATRMLETRGHSVVAVADGRAAIEAFEEEVFDAVLMDIEMEGMDGLTAAAGIRRIEDATNRHTPIIAMTGHVTIEDQERFAEAGIDHFAAKPLQPDQLLSTLAHLVTE